MKKCFFVHTPSIMLGVLVCTRSLAFYLVCISSNKYNRVIRKVRQLGGENRQIRHNRASNAELGMEILQKEITGTQTSFSTNFDLKLSFILSFLSPERLHCCYIYFHCSYRYNYYNYTRTLCIKC
jgi:hypothetical protein